MPDAIRRIFGKFYTGVRIRKPLQAVPGVCDMILHAAGWKREDDLYDAFFHAVGSPDWHGRNFNALRDSIVAGNINSVEVPYRLLVREFGRVRGSVRDFVNKFFSLVREFEAEGCPITVQFEAGGQVAEPLDA